jgi:hypothetical protein
MHESSSRRWMHDLFLVEALYGLVKNTKHIFLLSTLLDPRSSIIHRHSNIDQMLG